MPALPSWDPGQSVGNPELDRQHQRLYELAAQAIALAEGGSELRETFHRILNDITDLSFLHFAAEEEVLAHHGCPTLEQHKAEHDAYLEQLTRVLYQGSTGVDDRLALARLMRDFTQHHLGETDLESKAYMRPGP
jgi:hemerythrin